MDLPTTDLELNEKKVEELKEGSPLFHELNEKKVEEVKEGSPLFHCDLFDSIVIHDLAHIFLLGLATACVDNTTGDPFKGPALVAVDIRKEMVDYLSQRSETYVAESVIEEDGPDGELLEYPTDIISDFVDDFVNLKRNFFSRVSGWLLSESREDKIDDFGLEMELDGFWLLDRREAIARTLVKNVDFKSAFHCGMKFDTAKELEEHSSQCIYRSINCTNEGCSAIFCAVHEEIHDSVCPFKVLPCEQKCSENIVRHEMDRHCITDCPMKLVNCPFYSVGCQSSIPHCKIEEHRSLFFHSHILYVLQAIHKEASVADLNERVELLEKSSSPNQLLEVRDVKALEAKMGTLERKIISKASNGCTETASVSTHVPEETESQVQTSQESRSDDPES